MSESEGAHLRAFIAISLPGSIQQVLERIQAELRLKGIKASWAKPGSLHLTLKFLGNVPGEIESIKAAMVKTTDCFSRFELSLGRLGVFPNVKKPRVLWAGVEGQTDTLEQLFKVLEIHLQALGWKKERQRFSPHVTIGRIKKQISPVPFIRLMKEDKQIVSPLFEVPGIALFKSELTRSGAIHTCLFQAKINLA